MQYIGYIKIINCQKFRPVPRVKLLDTPKHNVATEIWLAEVILCLNSNRQQKYYHTDYGTDKMSALEHSIENVCKLAKVDKSSVKIPSS